MKRYRIVSEYAAVIKDVFTKGSGLPLILRVGEYIPESECTPQSLEYSLRQGFLRFAISQGWIVEEEVSEKIREEENSNVSSEKVPEENSNASSEGALEEATPKVLQVSSGEATTVIEVVPGTYVVSGTRVSLKDLDKLNSFRQKELVNSSTDIDFLEEIARRTKYKTVRDLARERISTLARR